MIYKYLLILILALGLFLRFYRIDELATFRIDQVVELTGAENILKGKLTLIGIKTSNSEVRNGAVMYYLLAPFAWIFNGDPVAGGVLQSLLSIGAALLMFVTLKENNNAKTGLIGAFLVAVSALLVIYSRQTLLAFYPLFFNFLAFYLAILILRKFTLKIVFLLGLLLGFTLQIHYSGLGAILANFIWPFLFLKKDFWIKYFTVLFAGIILGFSPLIVFELRHEFFNTKMALKLFSAPSASAGLSFMSVFYYWIDVISRLFFGTYRLMAYIFVLTIPLGLIIFRKSLQNVQKMAIVFLAASFLFTVAFYKNIQPLFEFISQYAIMGFGPLIILYSWLVGKLPVKILLILAVITLLFNWNYYGLAKDHGYTHRSGWGLPGIKKSANIIKNDITDQPYNVVMLVDAESQAYPLRYFLDGMPNPPLPVEAYDRAQNLYVVVEPNLNLAEINLWEISSFGKYTISKQWDLSNGFWLYKLAKSPPI